MSSNAWQTVAVKEGCKMVALNRGFLFRILSCSFEEKSEGKPGLISHVISGTVVTAVPCKRLKRHNAVSVALLWSAKKSIAQESSCIWPC